MTFPNPGVVPVFCHLHPNMSAAIVVAPSRWLTKPGVDGGFSLRGLPPGKHMIVAWHRSAGYFRKQLDVPAAGEVRIDLTIPVESPGAAR